MPQTDANQPGRGCMAGCKPRIEVIVKMPKKCRDGEGGGGSGWGCWGGGQHGCEPRIEVMMKMQK